MVFDRLERERKCLLIFRDQPEKERIESLTFRGQPEKVRVVTLTFRGQPETLIDLAARLLAKLVILMPVWHILKMLLGPRKYREKILQLGCAT